MATNQQTAGVPLPGLVFETLTAHQRSDALRAAIELDLFRAIGEGPGDVASLAKRCTASERGIRILCDFLTVIGLIQKEDRSYSHTATSAMFLDPRSPTCLAATARFLGNPALLEPYLRLAEIVRSGRLRQSLLIRIEQLDEKVMELQKSTAGDLPQKSIRAGR